MGIPVTTSHNLCLGAQSVGPDQEILHLVDRCCRGSLRQNVVKKVCLVGATDTLNPDVALAEGRFESPAQWDSKRSLKGKTWSA